MRAPARNPSRPARQASITWSRLTLKTPAFSVPGGWEAADPGLPPGQLNQACPSARNRSPSSVGSGAATGHNKDLEYRRQDYGD
jgi:hypothetical protein